MEPISSSDDFKSKGFTLIEVLIFIGISLIIVVLIFSVLVGFLRSQNNITKLSILQDTSLYVFNDLTQEIHWSDRIHRIADDELVLIKIQPDGETEESVVFNVENDVLFKNGEVISPSGVIVNSFDVNNLCSQPDEIPCLEIKLALEYANSDPTIDLESKTVISLRKIKYLETFD